MAANPAPGHDIRVALRIGTRRLRRQRLGQEITGQRRERSPQAHVPVLALVHSRVSAQCERRLDPRRLGTPKVVQDVDIRPDASERPGPIGKVADEGKTHHQADCSQIVKSSILLRRGPSRRVRRDDRQRGEQRPLGMTRGVRRVGSIRRNPSAGGDRPPGTSNVEEDLTSMLRRWLTFEQARSSTIRRGGLAAQRRSRLAWTRRPRALLKR